MHPGGSKGSSGGGGGAVDAGEVEGSGGWRGTSFANFACAPSARSSVCLTAVHRRARPLSAAVASERIGSTTTTTAAAAVSSSIVCEFGGGTLLISERASGRASESMERDLRGAAVIPREGRDLFWSENVVAHPMQQGSCLRATSLEPERDVAVI